MSAILDSALTPEQQAQVLAFDRLDAETDRKLFGRASPAVVEKRTRSLETLLNRPRTAAAAMKAAIVADAAQKAHGIINKRLSADYNHYTDAALLISAIKRDADAAAAARPEHLQEAVRNGCIQGALIGQLITRMHPPIPAPRVCSDPIEDIADQLDAAEDALRKARDILDRAGPDHSIEAVHSLMREACGFLAVE